MVVVVVVVEMEGRMTEILCLVNENGGLGEGNTRCVCDCENFIS